MKIVVKYAAKYFVVFFLLFPYLANAKTETLVATHKYQMGDNDSRNDARRMCFLEAKRKVIEKAGTYIKTYTQVKNYQLTKDEIEVYSAALLKVETVKEDWKLSGASMAVEITVKAEVDTSYMEKQLSLIKKDKSVQTKIKNQQFQIKDLERKVIQLQKSLGSVDATKASELRKERNVTFKQIDLLQEKKIEIRKRIQTRSRDACKHVETGMTKSDIRSLIGKADTANRYAWYYGKTKIDFNLGQMVESVYPCR